MWRHCRPGRTNKVPRPLQFKTHAARFSSHETISIPTQSNDALSLDIHHPTSFSPPPSSTVPPTVLIYLPRGPLLANESHEASNISLLRTSLPWTIVKLNYDHLLGQGANRFPALIHNVLAGYDWCHEHLLPKRSITRTGRSQHVGRIVVCGELLGGGLASMLALTECRATQPGIVAAALSNPITDWVGLDECAHSTRSSRRTQFAAPSLETELSTLKTQLFPNPTSSFDPFASPILFFRSAGINIPTRPPDPPLDDLEHLSLLEREEFFLEQHALSLITTETHTSQPSTPNATPEPQRRKPKASKRFPSASLCLRLPRFHISSSFLASPLEAQAKELVHQLRLSVARQNGRASETFGRKVLQSDEERDDCTRQLISEAEDCIRHAEYGGQGTSKTDRGKVERLRLWDDSPEGKRRVMDVANWLRDTFT
ncbi:Hypothetical protein R9X50_00139300 [Acrodontium crateriforme]|uniref:Alpha/beta hydrolase fold-3 domain-containing protein n=1 Tax=Acrodontium crateriforme TaxID=150365 RepID=A0AAQ3M2E2_9PEZI|nr:Hypothetical protein R9X50_00139300 [Acrodontium crateriforme]